MLHLHIQESDALSTVAKCSIPHSLAQAFFRTIIRRNEEKNVISLKRRAVREEKVINTSGLVLDHS